MTAKSRLVAALLCASVAACTVGQADAVDGPADAFLANAAMGLVTCIGLPPEPDHSAVYSVIAAGVPDAPPVSRVHGLELEYTASDGVDVTGAVLHVDGLSDDPVLPPMSAALGPAARQRLERAFNARSLDQGVELFPDRYVQVALVLDVRGAPAPGAVVSVHVTGLSYDSPDGRGYVELDQEHFVITDSTEQWRTSGCGPSYEEAEQALGRSAQSSAVWQRSRAGGVAF